MRVSPWLPRIVPTYGVCTDDNVVINLGTSTRTRGARPAARAGAAPAGARAVCPAPGHLLIVTLPELPRAAPPSVLWGSNARAT